MNSMEFKLEKYIRSSNENRIITVGQTIEGEFIVNIEQITGDGSNTIANMRLSEDDFVSITSAILLFADHYNMDLTQKIKEIFEPDKITFMTPVLTEAE